MWRLSSVPPELFGDELDVGYQAYSILKTGKDLQGNFLPIYFQSLAESRAPLFLYSTVPFVAIFGLNEWGVRLTAAFWGILGVLAIYFLTKKLFKSKFLSLASCLFLAISPWHLQYSRAGFEVTLLLFLLMSATWLFLKGLEKPAFFVFAAILLALTPYTYSTAAVFMPLFVLSSIIIFRQEIKNLYRKMAFKIAVLVFVIVLIPFGWQLMFGQATTRFSQISVAVNPEIEKNIVLERAIDKRVGVVFHNKALSFLFETSRNYLWAFSPQFLFTDGDPMGRHSVGGMGEFYWFQLPLLAMILFWFLRGKIGLDKKSLAIVTIWLILAPIPSSLTYDGANNATRLILLLPPIIIFSSIGLFLIYKITQGKRKIQYLVFVALGILALANIATYFHRYYVHYPLESWRWWQIGYKEAFSYIRQNQDQYDKIIINNTYEPGLIRMLFYLQYDLAVFHKNFKGDKPQKDIIQGFDGFYIDKFFFGTLGDRAKGLGAIATVLSPKTLYLASARDEIGPKLYLGVDSEKTTKILITITNYLNEPIFYLITGKEK